MMAGRNLAAAMAGALCVILSGCATTGGGLASSAERLERNTYALARNDNLNDGYTRDARELADEARDFRRIVNDRRADDRDVKTAFEELSRDYHALRDEIDRSDSREAQVDLRHVTEAYLDVEREMGGYSDGRRASRDRDRDRY